MVSMTDASALGLWHRPLSRQFNLMYQLYLNCSHKDAETLWTQLFLILTYLEINLALGDTVLHCLAGCQFCEGTV